jgi:DNA-binding LytR/AlgR family response regulator
VGDIAFRSRATARPAGALWLFIWPTAAHERIRHVIDQNRQLMKKSRNSTSNAAAEGPGRRFLLHLGPGLRQAIDPDDIYFVEATGDDTRVRTRGARALQDVRPIGEIEPLLLKQGFLRIHRNALVNPAHVREVRRRPKGEDWELQLDPPVNLVLPVSRDALAALWKAFGEE